MNVVGIVVLAAAAVGALLLLRRSPPFLGEPGGRSGEPLSDPEHLRLAQYSRWFIHMRWVAVLVALALAAATVALEFLPREALPPLIGSIGGLAAANFVFMALHGRRRGDLRLLLPVQLYTDLALLIVMLHLGGGIENPLYLFPVFNVIVGGIVLSRRQCFGLALMGGGLCAAAVWAEWAHWIPHYTLRIFPHGEGGDVHEAFNAVWVGARSTLQFVVLVLAAHFVSRLAEHSRVYERGLASMAQQARAGRELLEQALENTETGLRLVDPSLRALWANEQWRRWFPPGGDEESRLLAWAEGEGGLTRRTLVDSVPRKGELSMAGGPEGAPARAFVVRAAALHGQDGRLDRLVEFAQDVTAEKEVEARMLQASKLAAVGEVAGQLAHEINNPISIISAKARLLLSDHAADLSRKVAHDLERIVDLADRVARIAKGLLAYGRPSAGPRSPIDLAQPIRRALALVEDQARRQGVTFADGLGPGLPPVEANPGEMEQVFLNLFLNALDAMPQGGTLSLTVSAQESELPDGSRAVAVAVCDSGPGIPEALRKRVFDPFFTTKNDGRGSGLGLSICQGILRSHGGDIGAVDRPGCGGRLLVRVPILADEAGEVLHA